MFFPWSGFTWITVYTSKVLYKDHAWIALKLYCQFHSVVSDFLSWQEAALRAFYIPDEPQDYELQSYGQQGLFTDDIINRNGSPDNKPVFKDTMSDSWVLRAKPRETEVVKIYHRWQKWALLLLLVHHVLLFCLVLSDCHNDYLQESVQECRGNAFFKAILQVKLKFCQQYLWHGI